MGTLIFLLFLASLSFKMNFFSVLAGVAFIFLFIGYVACRLASLDSTFLDSEMEKQKLEKVMAILKKGIVVSLTILALWLIIPSSTILYTIAGLSAGLDIANNIQNSELFNKALNVLNNKLDELIGKEWKWKQNLKFLKVSLFIY